MKEKLSHVEKAGKVIFQGSLNGVYFFIFFWGGRGGRGVGVWVWVGLWIVEGEWEVYSKSLRKRDEL